MSAFTGEYWIFETGDISFADGDRGDRNHESFVLERAQTMLCDALGIDFDYETDDFLM